MDEKLIGCWRVKSTEMVENRVVSLIGGLPGEYVEFTADGRYRVDIKDESAGSSCYKVLNAQETNELDIWIASLARLVARCIYEIHGDTLIICIAGNYGTRPDVIRRDDDLLWCIVTMERAKRPKSRRPRRVPPLLEPGSLIPTEFLSRGPKNVPTLDSEE